jgi:hypothetical protein
MPPRKNMITSDQVGRVRDPATIASLEPAPIAPVAAAGGLTEREINADLEALNIEPDPTAPLADRLLQRNEARAARAEAPVPLDPYVAKALERAEVAPVLKAGTAPSAGSDSPTCRVRITKAGHNEVHDGRGGRYAWQAEVSLPRAVGKALEERHFGEMLD